MAELSNDHKPRELRARRKARRQGLVLSRSKLRDPDAIGYGTYSLHTEAGQLMSSPNGITLDEVEVHLTRRSRGELP